VKDAISDKPIDSVLRVPGVDAEFVGGEVGIELGYREVRDERRDRGLIRTSRP
jgi:hypothetical protein